ncbi:MAG: hypothetical protein Q8Q77_15930, partial [Phenylobacterium sp.]|nr:hypothetical protein [Phenylobacterium sp.]
MKAPKTGLSWEALSTRGKRVCVVMTSVHVLNAILVGEVAAQVRQPNGVDEVIVTARRREEALQQSPMSIAALPRQELEQRGALNLGDLPLANLSIREGAGASGAGFAPVM